MVLLFDQLRMYAVYGQRKRKGGIEGVKGEWNVSYMNDSLVLSVAYSDVDSVLPSPGSRRRKRADTEESE